MESIRHTILHSDTTITISIFDLGKSAEEMLENWLLLKKKGIAVTLSQFPDIDFYVNVDGRELMEVILGFFILIEKQKKSIIKEKQAQGIAKARKRGIRLGRRPKEIPENFMELYQSVQNHEISLTKATHLLGVDYKTFKKWIGQIDSIE